MVGVDNKLVRSPDISANEIFFYDDGHGAIAEGKIAGCSPWLCGSNGQVDERLGRCSSWIWKNGGTKVRAYRRTEAENDKKLMQPELESRAVMVRSKVQRYG